MSRADSREGLEQRLTTVKALAVDDLRTAWGTAFGAPPPARASRRLLLLSLGHRIQAEALGGLPAQASRRLERVAMGDLRPERPAITGTSRNGPAFFGLREGGANGAV